MILCENVMLARGVGIGSVMPRQVCKNDKTSKRCEDIGGVCLRLPMSIPLGGHRAEGASTTNSDKVLLIVNTENASTRLLCILSLC